MAHPPSTRVHPSFPVSSKWIFQTGQQLLNARILVLTSDFHKYGSAGTLNPIKIPQTRRTPIISFLFEAVNAADFRSDRRPD